MTVRNLTFLLAIVLSRQVAFAEIDHCSPHAVEQGRRVLAAALNNGFGVQYWGTGYDAKTLAAAPHGVIILEAAIAGAGDSGNGREHFFSRNDIRAIKRGDRPVLGYLNLAELEPWRDYWRDEPDALLFRGPITVDGEHLAAWWTDTWKATLLDRVDRLMSLGLDGLFLDDALQYFATAQRNIDSGGGPTTVPMSARSMMELVIEVSARIREHRCSAIVIVNNAVFVGRDAGQEYGDLFNRYRQAISAILVEDMLGGANHPDVHLVLREDYLRAGLPVLSIDFATTKNDVEDISKRAVENGYNPYVPPDNSFSSLAPPSITH